MEIKTEFESKFDNKKIPEADKIISPFQQSTNRSSFLKLAGFLLIIAGLLAIVNWIQIFSLESTSIQSFIDINQIREFNPNITYEQLLGLLQTCAIIGIIISVFPILAGLLAIQKKLYYIAIAGSIIGLFSIGIMFLSSILSLIGLILLIISRQNFQ